ncbi:MAG: PAS domain S-box protein [Nitrospirae bacterium]|nr:PAS domain S-box protein [Nitrospirota bacterium]
MSKTRTRRQTKKTPFQLTDWENLFDSIIDIITIHDRDFNIVYANKAAEKVLRLPFLNGRKIKCYKYYHGKNSPPNECPSCNCLKTGKPIISEMFEPHLNSFIEIRAIPQFDISNEPVGIIHIIRDVTERKQVEDRIKAMISRADEEKKKIEAIIAALGDGIIIQDTNYRIIYQNEIQNKLYGDQTGNYCYKSYEGLDTVCEGCPVEKTFQDGMVHKSERHLSTDNGLLCLELTSSPLKNSRGEIVAGIKLVRDVTDRKLAEIELQKHRNELMKLVEDRTTELTASNELLSQEIMDRREVENQLRRSEKKYRDLYNNAPDMYHSLNKDKIIIDCNDTEAKMLGYKKEEIIGRPIADFFTGDSRRLLEEDFPKLKNEKVLKNLERTFVKKDGATFPASINVFAEFDDQGEVAEIRAIARDITEIKRAEAEAIRAGHLAALGELAAGVAHEINNPINGILNYSEIIANKSAQGSKEHDIACRIIKEGDRIANIVRNLLSFTRNTNDEKYPAYISSMLSEILAMTETQLKKDGIQLKVSIPCDLPAVFVITQQIEQVFLNIISNARYALNQKYPKPHNNKILEIAGQNASVNQKPHVRITFHDRGTGIPQEIMDKVMNPFFSTKPANVGTGLGLSISHSIIANHNGNIRLSSVKNKFTKVIIELPVNPKIT